MLDDSRIMIARIALFVLLLAAASRVGAEDRVVTRDRRGNEVIRTGEIRDYNRRELILVRRGTPSRLPSDRIVRIQTEYLPAHLQADELFHRHEYAAALQTYREAFRVEKRTWVKRQILAQVVWCQRNRQQIQAAISSFILLLGNDPQTRFFHAIPLAWRPQQPNASLTAEAQRWLDDRTSTSVQRLIAASWLLSTSHRISAIETLRRLTRDRDTRIRQLAAAQLWRAEGVTTDREQVVSSWPRLLESMPIELQGGPYFVLGRALAHHGEHERAILAFMHVPIEYSQQHDLAAEALWEAGQLLQKTGDSEAAVRLYRELKSNYPESIAAGQAAAQLKRLLQPASEGARG